MDWGGGIEDYGGLDGMLGKTLSFIYSLCSANLNIEETKNL